MSREVKFHWKSVKLHFQLHIAAANGYLRVVEYLLDQHVATDVEDNDRWQPVHAAACWGHVSLLNSHGQLSRVKTFRKIRSMHHHLFLTQLEVLELLVQNGADLNAKNKHEETPAGNCRLMKTKINNYRLDSRNPTRFLIFFSVSAVTDICEDPEIRDRIVELKTEQESKKLREAQGRRVRRSQSINTRTQSVRRTSIRDKVLTTKKDAQEEARLRIQAQQVYRIKIISQFAIILNLYIFFANCNIIYFSYSRLMSDLRWRIIYQQQQQRLGTTARVRSKTRRTMTVILVP